jgi:nicotinate-nucleotide adenylyltransferase
LHKWKDWQGLMDELPFAVYPRPDYNLAALASPAARRFGGRILPAQESANLTRYGAPACVMLDGTHSAQSSTALRQKREAN